MILRQHENTQTYSIYLLKMVLILRPKNSFLLIESKGDINLCVNWNLIIFIPVPL